MLATTASADYVLQAVKQSTIFLTAFRYIYSISFERMTLPATGTSGLGIGWSMFAKGDDLLSLHRQTPSISNLSSNL
jgi:hypothetical protein